MASNNGYDVENQEDIRFISYGHGYDIGTTDIYIHSTTKWLLENIKDDISHIDVGEREVEGVILALIYCYGNEIGDQVDGEFNQRLEEWFDEQKSKRRRLYKEAKNNG